MKHTMKNETEVQYWTPEGLAPGDPYPGMD
jgi:hypothetical protein